MKSRKTIQKFLIVYSFLNLMFVRVAYAGAFPQIQTVDDEDVVRYYSPYVAFVADVSRVSDAASSNKMKQLFEELKRTDPEQAAQFLKGLRLELLHGLELANVDPRKMKSGSPTIRRIVAHGMNSWVSELDEALFRAQGNSNRSDR